MKTIRNILQALLLMQIVACSVIDEDERLIFVSHKEIETPDTTEDKFLTTVLVEDFTGQRCTWCPQGTLLLSEQMALFGADRVIPVAIHSGPLGFAGTPTQKGLMTTLGKYYWDQNGFTSTTVQPTAVFNRRHTTDNRDEWSSIIYAELMRTATIKLSITPLCSADGTLTTEVVMSNQDANEWQGKLQLWLTENDIVAMQIDNGVTKRDYVHNHVLREAINGNDGEAVTIKTGEAAHTATFQIPADYKKENCQVVAFVYNANGVAAATVANVQMAVAE